MKLLIKIIRKIIRKIMTKILIKILNFHTIQTQIYIMKKIYIFFKF